MVQGILGDIKFCLGEVGRNRGEQLGGGTCPAWDRGPGRGSKTPKVKSLWVVGRDVGTEELLVE